MFFFRSHRILQPKGIDLINIITSEDKTTFNNVLNSFLGIASIQIALTDVLRAMGLVPDKIIGMTSFYVAKQYKISNTQEIGSS